MSSSCDSESDLLARLIDGGWTVEDDGPPLHSLNNTVRFARTPEGRRVVVRRANTTMSSAFGIDRGVEAAIMRHAAAAGFAPAVIENDGDGLLILERLHAVRGWLPTDWSGSEARTRGVHLVRTLLTTSPPQLGGVPTTYDRIRGMLRGAGDRALLQNAAALLSRLDAIADERAQDRRYAVSLAHHDLWSNNLVDDGEKLWLIDYEFAGSGDGWFDLATVTHEAGFDADGKRTFLEEVGRRGDADDLRALAQGEWLFHLFEMLWALHMSDVRVGRRLSGVPFDYAAHAAEMASWLESAGRLAGRSDGR